MAAAKPDYGALKKSNAAPGLFDGLFSFRKYMNSKLHNVYFATELDTKLRERGVTNVYVNSCHPGSLPFLLLLSSLMLLAFLSDKWLIRHADR